MLPAEVVPTCLRWRFSPTKREKQKVRGSNLEYFARPGDLLQTNRFLVVEHPVVIIADDLAKVAVTSSAISFGSPGFEIIRFVEYIKWFASYGQRACPVAHSQCSIIDKGSGRA